MGEVKRGKAQKSDLLGWDGKNLTGTRVDATGGTITGLVADYEVDVLEQFGDSTSYSLSTITKATNHIGGSNVTLVFAPGTWTIDDDLTIASNLTCRIPAGCIFNVSSGKTLTFSGFVFAENSTYASGSGSVSIGLTSDAIIAGVPWITKIAEETSAGVTPTALQYEPYIGRRYSTKADWESITTNLYVATGGSDSNDGETSGAPFATLQKALDTIAMFSNALPGKWQINCAAGTYSTATNSVSDWPLGLLTNKLVDIVGPDVSGHPNVPTAIFDGTNSSTTGFRCSTGAKVKLKDLKFQNYTTANAISGSGVCTLVLDNVHTDDADHGVIATTQCRLYVNGGLFDLVTPNTACIASEFFSVHHIGYSFNETTGTPTAGTDPTLTGDGTGIGMLVKEFASGHVGAVLDNFATGADISINSRIHFDSGTDIKNNGTGVKATHQSMFIDSGITWNTGGGDANTNNVMLRNFSSQADDGTAVTPRMTKKELLLSQHTGTTDETFLQSFTLRVGEWMGSRNSIYEGRILRVKMYGGITGTAGTKTIRWRISTSSTGVAGTAVGIAAIAASPAGNFVHEFELHVNGASAQRTQSSTIVAAGAILVGGSTPSVAMSGSAEQYINLTIQLANGNDAANINALSYEVVG